MVEYTLINFVTFSLGVIFLFHGYRLVRKGREAIVLFFMSGTIGTGLIVVALVPNVFEFVAGVIGLELKARAILVISNLTLFVAIFYMVHRISVLYDSVSRLNEELSLLKTRLNERDE